MPVSPKRMPFMSHLDELRKRLTVVIAVVGVFAIAGYMFSDQVFRLLTGPMIEYVGQATAIDLMEAMTNRFRLGIFAAVVVGSPVIIYEILAFFLPALRPSERRWFGWTFVAAALLFLAGVAMCYFLVLGRTTDWLVAQGGDLFQMMVTGKSMISFAMWFLVGFGLAFEVPVIIFYLVYFNVVPYAALRKNWRVVWVVMVVIASMITPDFSPVSMGALSVAMIALFEGSMFFVRLALARKIARAENPIEDTEEIAEFED